VSRELRVTKDDKTERDPRDEPVAPVTPTDEPQPAPVQDPPAEPGRPPLVVANKSRTEASSERQDMNDAAKGRMVNGERKERWSGEIGWQTVQFNVPAGFNTVEWRYVKDANSSAGLDAAFIDNLNLPVAAAPVPVGAPRLSAVRNFDGSVQLSLIGQPNQQFTIQASANLASWQTIGTVTTTASGSANIIDPSRGLFTHRFYRAIR